MEKEIRYADKPWLAFYDEGIKAELDYGESCLPDFLDKTVKEFPDRTAFNYLGYEISYLDFNDMVNRFANFLIKIGIKKGDCVSIILPNTITCVASYYAVLRIGGIAVMMNPLDTDREIIRLLTDCEAKMVVTLDLIANRIIKIKKITKIENIVYSTFGDYLPIGSKLLYPFISKKRNLSADVNLKPYVYKWKKVIRSSSSKPPEIKIAIEDDAMLQFTGGTTGIPKGVLLTHGNLSKQVQQISSWFSEFKGAEERMVGALPFFHVFGLSCSMNYSIYAGFTNILVPKPVPDELLETIKKYKPTFAPLVPTMFIGLMNHPDANKVDFSSIKCCFSGSAPIPVDVLKKFEIETKAVISEGFGMTETSPSTHINPFKGVRKKGSIGIPLPDTECKIVDLVDSNIEVPVGEQGELLIKGPQVMKGYWKKTEESEIAVNDGWLHTGDIAKMDEDGYFFIVGRKKDLIISGGFNIYPRDIDEVMNEHEKVLEACSIGVPHPTRGEQVKVFVVLNEDAEITEKELLDYCKTKLAAIKVPAIIEFRPNLPKTTVGKIIKGNL